MSVITREERARLRAEFLALDPAYAEAKFIVEATAEERFNLWSEYAVASRDQCKHMPALDWITARSGRIVNVGNVEIDGALYPNNITIHAETINGVVILFYESPSLVTHWGKIKIWWKDRFPVYYDGFRWAQCNATNFHQAVLNVIPEQKHGPRINVEEIDAQIALRRAEMLLGPRETWEALISTYGLHVRK